MITCFIICQIVMSIVNDVYTTPYNYTNGLHERYSSKDPVLGRISRCDITSYNGPNEISKNYLNNVKRNSQTMLNETNVLYSNNRNNSSLLEDMSISNDTIKKNQFNLNNQMDSQYENSDPVIHRNISSFNNDDLLQNDRNNDYRKKWAQSKGKSNFFASKHNTTSRSRERIWEEINGKTNLKGATLNTDLRILIENILSNLNDTLILDQQKGKNYRNFEYRKDRNNPYNKKNRVKNQRGNMKNKIKNYKPAIFQLEHRSKVEDKTQKSETMPSKNNFCTFNMLTFFTQPEFGIMTETMLPIKDEIQHTHSAENIDIVNQNYFDPLNYKQSKSTSTQTSEKKAIRSRPGSQNTVKINRNKSESVDENKHLNVTSKIESTCFTQGPTTNAEKLQSIGHETNLKNTIIVSIEETTSEWIPTTGSSEKSINYVNPSKYKVIEYGTNETSTVDYFKTNNLNTSSLPELMNFHSLGPLKFFKLGIDENIFQSSLTTTERENSFKICLHSLHLKDNKTLGDIDKSKINEVMMSRNATKKVGSAVESSLCKSETNSRSKLNYKETKLPLKNKSLLNKTHPNISSKRIFAEETKKDSSVTQTPYFERTKDFFYQIFNLKNITPQKNLILYKDFRGDKSYILNKTLSKEVKQITGVTQSCSQKDITKTNKNESINSKTSVYSNDENKEKSKVFPMYAITHFECDNAQSFLTIGTTTTGLRNYDTNNPSLMKEIHAFPENLTLSLNNTASRVNSNFKTNINSYSQPLHADGHFDLTNLSTSRCLVKEYPSQLKLETPTTKYETQIMLTDLISTKRIKEEIYLENSTAPFHCYKSLGSPYTLKSFHETCSIKSDKHSFPKCGLLLIDNASSTNAVTSGKPESNEIWHPIQTNTLTREDAKKTSLSKLNNTNIAAVTVLSTNHLLFKVKTIHHFMLPLKNNCKTHLNILEAMSKGKPSTNTSNFDNNENYPQMNDKLKEKIYEAWMPLNNYSASLLYHSSSSLPTFDYNSLQNYKTFETNFRKYIFEQNTTPFNEKSKFSERISTPNSFFVSHPTNLHDNTQFKMKMRQPFDTHISPTYEKETQVCCAVDSSLINKKIFNSNYSTLKPIKETLNLITTVDQVNLLTAPSVSTETLIVKEPILYLNQNNEITEVKQSSSKESIPNMTSNKENDLLGKIFTRDSIGILSNDVMNEFTPNVQETSNQNVKFTWIHNDQTTEVNINTCPSMFLNTIPSNISPINEEFLHFKNENLPLLLPQTKQPYDFQTEIDLRNEMKSKILQSLEDETTVSQPEFGTVIDEKVDSIFIQPFLHNEKRCSQINSIPINKGSNYLLKEEETISPLYSKNPIPIEQNVINMKRSVKANSKNKIFKRFNKAKPFIKTATISSDVNPISCSLKAEELQSTNNNILETLTRETTEPSPMLSKNKKIPFLYGISKIDLPPSEFGHGKDTDLLISTEKNGSAQLSKTSKFVKFSTDDFAKSLFNANSSQLDKNTTKKDIKRKYANKHNEGDTWDGWINFFMSEAQELPTSTEKSQSVDGLGFLNIPWKFRGTNYPTTISERKKPIKYKLFQWRKKGMLSTTKYFDTSTEQALTDKFCTKEISTDKENVALRTKETDSTTPVDFYEFVSTFWSQNKNNISNEIKNFQSQTTEDTAKAKTFSEEISTFSLNNDSIFFSSQEKINSQDNTTWHSLINLNNVDVEGNSFLFKSKTAPSPEKEPLTPLPNFNYTNIEDGCNVCTTQKASVAATIIPTSRVIFLYETEAALFVTPKKPMARVTNGMVFSKNNLTQKEGSTKSPFFNSNFYFTPNITSKKFLKESDDEKLYGLLQKHLIVLLNNKSDVPFWLKDSIQKDQTSFKKILENKVGSSFQDKFKNLTKILKFNVVNSRDDKKCIDRILSYSNKLVPKRNINNWIEKKQIERSDKSLFFNVYPKDLQVSSIKHLKGLNKLIDNGLIVPLFYDRKVEQHYPNKTSSRIAGKTTEYPNSPDGPLILFVTFPWDYGIPVTEEMVPFQLQTKCFSSNSNNQKRKQKVKKISVIDAQAI